MTDLSIIATYQPKSDGQASVQALELPWPNAVLNPNNHKHWKAKMKPAKAQKTTAFALTKQANLTPFKTHKIHVIVDFYAEDRRHRDSDNFLTALKSGLDGVALAMGIDDSRFIHHAQIVEEISKPPKVILTFIEQQDGIES